MKQLSLNILKPCTESWDNFRPVANGRFCSSCNKTVVDFTMMNDSQILDFFKNEHHHLCGRFAPGQLKTYVVQPQANIRPGFKLLYAGLVGLLLVLASRPAHAQHAQPKRTTEVVAQNNVHQKATSSASEHKVRGIVKSEEGDALPGVNIILLGRNSFRYRR
jgi:hypothetical protein